MPLFTSSMTYPGLVPFTVIWWMYSRLCSTFQIVSLFPLHLLCCFYYLIYRTMSPYQFSYFKSFCHNSQTFSNCSHYIKIWNILKLLENRARKKLLNHVLSFVHLNAIYLGHTAFNLHVSTNIFTITIYIQHTFHQLKDIIHPCEHVPYYALPVLSILPRTHFYLQPSLCHSCSFDSSHQTHKIQQQLHYLTD